MSTFVLIAILATGCSESQPDQPEGLFVPVDVVKAALDRGEALTLVDARPKADYDLEHITGALSLPYYDGDDRWSELLPLDRRIITYCGCPHAESGMLAQTLISHGFTDVHALDEGFFVWRERGYPTVRGSDQSDGGVGDADADGT